MKAVKDLLKYSVDEGYLREDYKLMGHRQVRSTECPGQRLYDEIKTWDNHISKPAGPEDQEIPPH